MTLEELSNKVLNVVEEFDATTAPLGLYSARDILLQPQPNDATQKFAKIAEREDLRVISPFIQKLSDVSRWAKDNQVRFFNPISPTESFELTMVRTAKIKVRKYGSSYQLDKQLDFSQRWQAVELDEEIARLKRLNSKIPIGILLFVGFDRVTRPFEREISVLKNHQKRKENHIEFFSREWKDRYKRGFWVRAAIWVRQTGSADQK